MRILLALSVVSMLAACGDDPSPVAEIGWQFDYKDYTDDTAAEDLRGCDNAPPSHAGPAYTAIETVTINIQDPNQQVPGIDHKDFPCAQGVGSDRVPIRGIVKQIYELTIEAKTAGGTVLYRHHDAAFDLSSEVARTIVLRTTTGEMGFTPTYAGSAFCPSPMPTQLRYRMYESDGRTAAANPIVAGVLSPACDDGIGGNLPNSLFVKEVPVDIDPSTRDRYVQFRVVIEASDTDYNVSHCTDLDGRETDYALVSIRPGNGGVTLNHDRPMSPGACP